MSIYDSNVFAIQGDLSPEIIHHIAPSVVYDVQKTPCNVDWIGYYISNPCRIRTSLAYLINSPGKSRRIYIENKGVFLVTQYSVPTLNPTLVADATIMGLFKLDTPMWSSDKGFTVCRLCTKILNHLDFMCDIISQESCEPDWRI